MSGVSHDFPLWSVRCRSRYLLCRPGRGPTGPREARPDDRLRPRAGTHWRYQPREGWVPGLSRCARSPGTTAEGARAKAELHRPLSLCGRGGSPVFRSLFPPPMRGGWRAERRSVRISPDGPGITRAVTHHTDAPASPDAPCAVSIRFRVYGGRTIRGLTPQRWFRLAARGRGYEARPQVPHPVPVLRRPAENAPRLERDDGNIVLD